MSRRSFAASSPVHGTPRKNKRQSLSSFSVDKSDSNTQLYKAIIKDPKKKAMVLQLFAKEKHLIYEYLQKNDKTPIKQTTKNKPYESPIALFRRKAMEKQHAAQEGDSSSSSEGRTVVPSPVPFEKLLEGVVAFVEVKTRSGDRSSATKAVVASMGAKIRDELTKDVTHVIFKDGSYNTFYKANLIKAHLVSLLWIEAVRKSHARVPEKNYPALGTEAFNANLSILCQQMQDEYEEAVQDEVHKTLNSSKISPETAGIKRILPTELLNSRSSAVKALNGTSRQVLQNLSEENQSFISSDSSDYGLIDGEITKKIIQDLELSQSPKDNNPEQIIAMKSIENIEDSRRTSDSSRNNTADTSNGSTSLLNVKKLQSLTGGKNKNNRKSKSNENVDMDLTRNSGTMLKVTTVNKLLPQQVCEEVKQKERSAKQKLFTEDLVASNDNDLTKLSSDVSNQFAAKCESSEEMSNLKLSLGNNKSLEEREVKGDNLKTNRESAKQKLFVSPKPIADDSSTMSSLRLSSSSSKANEKENSNEIHKQKRKTNNVPVPEASPPKIKKPEGATKRPTRRKSVVGSDLKKIEEDKKKSSDSSNVNDKEDGTNETGKQKCKTNNEGSPPKVKEQEGATKRPTRRKLYNPDEPLNGSYLKITEDSPKKTKTTFKKPPIPLTPVLLTTKAKRFLDEKKDKEEDEDVLTLIKKLETKLKTTAKSTEKKATVVTESEDRRKTRSSSFYFDKTPIKSSQKKVKKKTSIVCTRLHKPEVEVFQQIVKKLGGFYIEDEVTNNTTHLVAGESKRTINLLRAVARGCWILKHEWLLKSLEARKWLPEEEYELTEFSGAVQRCRIERQAFGSSYSMDIFRECGYIYVARSTIPRCSDLQELVRLCKGRLTTTPSRAKIVVGELVVANEVVCVKETWILDSIAENKLKHVKNYLIQENF